MRSPRTVVIVAALIALVAVPAAAAAGAKASSSEAALLKEMNRVRAANGLHPLVFDAALIRAAHAHTQSMSSSGVFAHGNVRSRLSQFRVTGPRVGENIAWGSGQLGTSAGIVKAWLASPGHRRNLLDPGFRRIGLGELQTRFLGADGASVVTADFAGV